MNWQILIDVVGWIGTGCILLAYILLSAGRLRGNNYSYQGLNLVGGIFLVVNTVYYGAYPSTFLNFVWAIIAIVALVQARRTLLPRS
jgi:phosphoglycerol transferase MdoB-like AlkP superfamily enzyme